MSGPYDEEPCSVVKFHPARAGRSGSRALVSQAKAMDGAKTLDGQHPRTRRRREGGTLRQSTDETGEIRLGTGTMVAGCRPAMPGNGEAYKQRSCERVERRAEVGGGRSSRDGWDNTTRRSEGPLARCAGRPKTTVGLPFGLFTHPSLAVRSRNRKRSLGRPTTSAAWRNADDRLPGGKPDEGEPHVRFGEGALETEYDSHGDGLSTRGETPGTNCGRACTRTTTAPAPYFTLLGPGPAVREATLSITGDGKCQGAERKSEGAEVVLTAGTTQPGPSEGPLLHRCMAKMERNPDECRTLG
jgi:hypothetical protein